MPRNRAPENMSYAELTDLRARIDGLMVKKRSQSRAELREKMAKLAKEEGLSLIDLLDGRRDGRKGKGSVPIKYRDPKKPANTWTGRGRMPRWMVAAMKGNRAKKDDFLI